MTKDIVLKATSRKEGKVSELRKKGIMPAVLYGPNLKENINLSIKLLDFERAYNEVGEASLIDLQIDEKDIVKVIVRDVQWDPLKDIIIHADFYGVDMTKKLIAPIPLNFIGQSKAVKEMGGLLMKNVDFVEVECLPSDLIKGIDVDLALLDKINAVIRIKDLNVPATVSFTHDPEDVIASISEIKEVKEVPKDEVAVDEKAEGVGDKKGDAEQKTEGK